MFLSTRGHNCWLFENNTSQNKTVGSFEAAIHVKIVVFKCDFTSNYSIEIYFFALKYTANEYDMAVFSILCAPIEFKVQD